MVAAVTARVGTSLIIPTVVPLALLRAEVAYLSTDPANLPTKLRLASHELDRRPADAGAVCGQADTIGQKCCRWLETRTIGTTLTLTGTEDAGVDAGIKIRVDHGGTPRDGRRIGTCHPTERCKSHATGDERRENPTQQTPRTASNEVEASFCVAQR
jgi:hypothetical protein